MSRVQVVALLQPTNSIKVVSADVLFASNGTSATYPVLGTEIAGERCYEPPGFDVSLKGPVKALRRFQSHP